MKKLILGLLGATALFSTQAQAFDASCCGCFEVGAEALYWKACHSPYQFGVLESSTSNAGNTNDFLSVKPSSEWGVRVWVDYQPIDKCWFTSLGWTYVRPSNSTSAKPNGSTLLVFTSPNNTRAFPAEKATAKIRSRYNKVDWRFGYCLHRACGLNFYGFGGVRYIDIDHTRELRFAGAVQFAGEQGVVRSKSEWTGAAFEIGAGFEYDLGCCVNLAASFAGMAGIGEQKLSNTTTGQSNNDFLTENYSFPSFTSCVPGIEARIGVNYTYTCGCGTLKGEIGYEIDYYFGIISIVARTNAASSICENFGFAGPYASLSLCF